MYELLDAACAEELGVSVETFIEKIERTTEKRMELIISATFSGDLVLIEKAKRIFNLIR